MSMTNYFTKQVLKVLKSDRQEPALLGDGVIIIHRFECWFLELKVVNILHNTSNQFECQNMELKFLGNMSSRY